VSARAPTVDVPTMKEIAERLQAAFDDGWIILFGDYSLMFVAFPKFAVPLGTWCVAKDSMTLRRYMADVEKAYLPKPQPQPVAA
jgi:hypothetical protein